MFGFRKSKPKNYVGTTDAKGFDAPFVSGSAETAVARVQNLQLGDPKGFVRGKHYTERVEEVKELKRSNNLAAAEALLLECVSATEGEAIAEKRSPAPWYYDQLGIVYRKMKDVEASEAIAQRKATKVR